MHAKEVLGEDMVPASRTKVSKYCKFSGCSKFSHLKCFCMEHAHVELGEEVVEEHVSKRRERDAKRKRGDDDGDNDS